MSRSRANQSQMTPNDLADRISGITARAEERLESAVTKTQKQLFDDIQAMLSRLELDGDGLIKQSASNRKILQKVDRVFDRAMKESGYYASLDQYAGAISSLTTANDAYFNFILETFTIDAHYLKSLQKSSIQTIESLLANEGLEVQLRQPLKDILNQNVNSGAAFSDLLKQVREFINGTIDREGKLMRYSKQVSRDALFNFSRSMQESVAENAGMEYYLFAGASRKDSRPFCATHAGAYYHRTEIEKWANQSWAGKRQGTTKSSIYMYLGGYNCEHSLIPVSKSVVPLEVIKRIEG